MPRPVTPLALLLAASACGGTTHLASKADAPAADAASADAPAGDTLPADAGFCSSPAVTSSCPVRSQYVTSAMVLPTSSSQAASPAFAFQLDGDPGHHYDNQLGQIAAALVAQGFDPQASTDAAFRAGKVILLWQYDSSGTFPAAEAPDALQAFLGLPAGASMCALTPDGGVASDAGCNFFSGTGEFSIDPAHLPPAPAFFRGAVSASVFTGGPAAAVLPLAIFGAAGTVDLPLYAARVRGTVAASGIASGLLGGGIRESDLQQQLFPAIAAVFNAEVAMGGSAGMSILALFDGDCAGSTDRCPYASPAACSCVMDGTISSFEVLESSLLQSLFAPDLDLFDGCGRRDGGVSATDPCLAGGTYHPLADGVPDSLSVGLQFQAVPAKIDGAP